MIHDLEGCLQAYKEYCGGGGGGYYFDGEFCSGNLVFKTKT